MMSQDINVLLNSKDFYKVEGTWNLYVHLDYAIFIEVIGDTLIFEYRGDYGERLRQRSEHFHLLSLNAVLISVAVRYYKWREPTPGQRTDNEKRT